MPHSPSPIELLVPTPRSLRRLGGEWCLEPDEGLTCSIEGSADGRAVALLARALSPREVIPANRAEGVHVQFRIMADRDTADQGYRLRVGPDGIRIDASTDVGAFYGACTLAQLLASEPARDASERLCVPALEIDDAPDFERRGVMLDVSRDRVPRMETLFTLVERLSRWKVSELQLYMEHTFAYEGHRVVWTDASPFRASEIVELGRFCAERFIDLVPNQQSLGHFHRWLVHEEYRDLAECPEGVAHPFAVKREPFSLAPTRPESLAFVRGLHDELLGSFESRFLNVGLDETFDIGEGAAREAVEARGKGRVYLEYLRAVHDSVSERGMRMQFWGDVILEHPDLVPELPRGAIALEWGYEADHPFDEHARRFAEAGLDFYVCPGTSTWLSLCGRLRNATANLRHAARAGLANGAVGYLITDWGDFGHWQPAPASYAPFLAGASRAWNAEGAPPDLSAALDRHVFGRAPGTGSPGETWAALGDIYLESGAHAVNGSPLFLLLRFAHEGWPHARIEGLTHAGLERTLARLEELRESFANVRMTCDDRALVRRETEWAFSALAFACALGHARLDLPEGAPLSALDPGPRGRLREEWDAVRAGLAPIWLARSRQGGLADSLARFDLLTELLS